MDILLIVAAIILSSVLVAIVVSIRNSPSSKATSKAIKDLTDTLQDLSGMVKSLEGDNSGLRKRVRELEAGDAISKGRISQLERRTGDAIQVMEEVSRGIHLLAQQIEDSGGTPIWEAPSDLLLLLSSYSSSSGPSLAQQQPPETQLYQLIGEYFDLGEIRELCMILRVNYENLIGETRQIKAMSLVDYAKRHDMLGALQELAKVKRPFVREWPQLKGDDR